MLSVAVVPFYAYTTQALATWPVSASPGFMI